MIDGLLSRFGKSYMGDPAKIAAELAADEAFRSADTLMLTVPNQLGVEYNVKLLANVAKYIAPALVWKATAETAGAPPAERSRPIICWRV
ncbi:hypothetical protein [Paenarthrobacter sp. PH39-S1]|uniref:hypothetical protein n=1 Tax=Paenarthrobacter sp. PH39-S1 TaxID=3046204 RepID=UPI0032D91631